MRKDSFCSSLIAISLSILTLFIGVSCDKENADNRPDLPPVESLVMDFSDFSQQPGAMKAAEGTYVNFLHSYFSVFFWNVAATVTFAPPVIAYAYALHQTPEYLGDNRWEWAYSVPFGQDSLMVTLTGARISNEEFSMEMIIAAASSPSQGVKWFDGVVRYDHTHAEWNFYKNGSVKVLEAEWNKDFETNVADLTYTYAEAGHEQKGSYIMLAYEPTEVYDATYTISLVAGMTTIQWNTTTKEGRVKDEVRFGDSAWHCWDTHANGLVDKICAE